jgi:nitroreductase
MNTSKIKRTIYLLIFLLGSVALSHAAESNTIQLPPPQMDGGQPLMKALKARKTTRAFGTKTIPQQVLSNLLWAADGINRPESGGRTAPSSWDWHNIDIYVATSDGLYLYGRKGNTLTTILQEDIRSKTGNQPSTVKAPIVLIYVADYANNNITNYKTFETFPAPYTQRVIESTAGVGFISQNVYLFCASEGLVTGVRATINKPPLSKIMRLKSSQDVIFAQSVGYPKKKQK